MRLHAVYLKALRLPLALGKLTDVSRHRASDSTSAPSAVEWVRGVRPDDESWRADALAGSRHSRWTDELREPLDIHDLDHAKEICGNVARLALQDFAPSLLLLEAENRLRLQAITAYILTLFDFVRQSGLEGERLTAVNRWEFALEGALDGSPPGQPVFVMLADLERRQPWARAGFDQLHKIARRRIALTPTANLQAAADESLMMGRSLLWLLQGFEPSESTVRFASGLVRLRSLMNLGDDLRRHRSRLPGSELAVGPYTADIESAALEEPIEAECERLRHILQHQDGLASIPPGWRRASRYSRSAGLVLIKKIRALGTAIVGAPPRLGLFDRLVLLGRCRWP